MNLAVRHPGRKLRTGDRSDHSDDRRHDEQVRRHGDTERNKRRADRSTRNRADAEARVEARHDRAAQALLDLRALDVHRDVPRAVADAEQEQADNDWHNADAVAGAAVAMPTAATTVMIATVRAGPSRATTTPASGIDTSDPIAIASSTRPRPRGESPSASRTCGMRDAQLANANPLKMKTT